MKTTVCFAVLLVFAAVIQNRVNAAVFSELVDPKPDHPGKCYHSLTNKVYSVGEKWQHPNECVQYQCGKEGDKFYIQGFSCGSMAVAPPCKVVDGSTDVPYPDCCPKVECPEKK